MPFNVRVAETSCGNEQLSAQKWLESSALAVTLELVVLMPSSVGSIAANMRKQREKRGGNKLLQSLKSLRPLSFDK